MGPDLLVERDVMSVSNRRIGGFGDKLELA